MKHLGKMAFGAIALLLASCSSDEPIANGNGTPIPEDAQFYATLNLRLPSATRAEGDNNGFEIGKDRENNVGSVYIILATKGLNSHGQDSYLYLTSTRSDASYVGTDGTNNEQVKYLLNFSAKNIGALTEGSSVNEKEVYVFAYCNPSSVFDGKVKNLSAGDEFLNLEGSIVDKDNAYSWQDNSFLMTNCEISGPVTIPSRDVLVNTYNKPETPFSLGTVKVKRVVARFDFASTFNTIDGEEMENVYEIKDLDGQGTMGTVELTQMALFNICKDFYYIPRTNSSWSWGGTRTLCGDPEADGQYVVSPGRDWRQKASLGAEENKNEYADKFFCNVINNKLEQGTGEQALTWVSLRDWNSRHEEDNDENWTPSAGTNYHIWRYTTENTIPGTLAGGVGSQKVGITTGVVFKGEFTPAADKTEVWNGNTVYVYNNIVYGDFAALKTYVDKNPDSSVAGVFDEAFEAYKDVDFDEVSDDFLKQDLLAGKTNTFGFKSYKADAKGKYVMYYFYYNRHKNNGNNSLMGVNEFGVVRNNVYKLQVTKCGTLGSPKSPNDPDTPDETENAYFTVECLVMPWTVRVNNIEF